VFSAAYQDPALQGYLQRIRYNMPAEWFAGREYAIQDCAGCGLLFQRDVLDDAQASRLYGQNEAGLRLEEDDSVLALAHLAADALLARRLVEARRPRVLDFGMGWGRFALLAQGFGCEVDGVEMSETTREHARRHGIRVLDEKDLPEAQYDFILADQVMEHLVEPVLLARRLASRLKPGGCSASPAIAACAGCCARPRASRA
jgi:2-polyprenyl-3-methyl-5-hydroxy-6-metoxy-1,4-benzoquinol methylase